MASQSRRDIFRLFSTAFLVTFTLSPPLIAIAAGRYAFDPSYPPLLSKVSDVTSPDLPLSLSMGSASWTEDVMVGRSSDGMRIRSAYQATRSLRWVPSAYIRRSVDVEVTETETVTLGFNETQRQTMAQILGMSVGVGQTPVNAFSASVKAALSLTEESIRHWSTSRTETRKVSYKAGNTYVNWQLLDNLVIVRNFSDQQHNGETVINEKRYSTGTVTSQIVIKTYEDSATDEQRQAARS